MVKFIVLLAILVTLFAKNGISQNQKDRGDSIHVIGLALNAKAGAVVKIKNGNTYYLDGINAWNENITNKTIEVHGILKKENFKKEDLKNENGEWMQGMVGEKLTILKPVWNIQPKK
jgi:hypothetical protein